MIAEPHGTSWPSSHPAVLTTFTRVAARELGIGALGRTALTALDASVAASRVSLGVHYPSDVASGLLLGRAVARLWPRAAPGAHLGSPSAIDRLAADARLARVRRLARHRPLPLRGLVRDLPARDRHRRSGSWSARGSSRSSPCAAGSPIEAANSVVFWSLIGVARRRPRRLRDRARLRLREPARVAPDLEGRDLAARRDRRRHDRERGEHQATGLPVPLLPGRRHDRALPRARHLGRAASAT